MINLSFSSYNFGIYAIALKGTKWRYIGSSADIRRRWRSHVYMLQRNIHHAPHLQRAWNKYGEDAFVFSMVEICPITLLLEREEAYLHNVNNLYNATFSALSPMRGRKHSQKTIARMRIGQRNRSPERLARLSKSLKAFWASGDGVTRKAEARENMESYIKARGPILSPYDRQRLSSALEGDLPDYLANEAA